jgi:hypothetical protein
MFGATTTERTRDARVCRSKGRIGLVSWTPQGFPRRLSNRSPARAATSEPLAAAVGNATTQQLFTGATSIQHEKRIFAFRYESAEHL